MQWRVAVSSCAVFVFCVVCASPGSTAAISGDLADVMSCLEVNAPRENSYQLIELHSTDHTGSVRRRVAKVYWKLFPDGLSKLLVRVVHPLDSRGAAYLAVQTDGTPQMFLYLPAVGRVRRINSRAATGSVFGTDFSFEDLQYLQGIAGGSQVSRGSDGELRGRPTYVVHVNGLGNPYSSYGSIRYTIDQETCSTLRVGFVAPNGDLLKQLDVEPESLVQSGHVWVPGHAVLTDFENQTHTSVQLEEIEVDGVMKQHVFSQSSLIRRR